VLSSAGSQYVLIYDSNGVALHPVSKKEGGAVTVEFLQGKSDHRRKHGGGSGQLIAKAVGLKPGIRPSVFDATAGLGQDAFVLATLGCDVLAAERSPIVYALLADGLQRARLQAQPDLLDILNRVTLLPADAVSWLGAQDSVVADVIYLDPMFPAREKSSLVKKEMRYFKSVVGADTDSAALLVAALAKAKYRVVVKRPRLAPCIDGVERTIAIEGKSSRYDIYALKSMDELKGR
jgi:16S rRNA (guanine1516-N2)-methyltransferase